MSGGPELLNQDSEDKSGVEGSPGASNWTMKQTSVVLPVGLTGL